MPEVRIDSNDREKIRKIVNFVGDFLRDFPVEARIVLAVEMTRLLKPELDEAKRRASHG